jgi:hypothetical protein
LIPLLLSLFLSLSLSLSPFIDYFLPIPMPFCLFEDRKLSYIGQLAFSMQLINKKKVMDHEVHEERRH